MEKYQELLAQANLAFSGTHFDRSLDLAEKAIAVNPNIPDAYYTAGKSCMSLDHPKEAVKYFDTATKQDKSNGNGYFLLGYALMMAEDYAKALGPLTRALELDCTSDLKGQIYKMLSMLNSDAGDFSNALVNLEHAEEFCGVDYELLQQKAACLAQLKDFRGAFYTLNQMKLLKPNDYLAYSLAVTLFLQMECYNEAKEELERAKRYAALTFDYYKDKVNYLLLRDYKNDTEESISTKWKEILVQIDEGLKKGRPRADQVADFYLRAANVYLSLNEPDNSIKILDQMVDVVKSFNMGFSVLFDDSETLDYVPQPEYNSEYEENLMQERWDNGELEQFREGIEEALLNRTTEDSEELSEEIRQCLTPIENIPPAKEYDEKYTITNEYELDQVNKDTRNVTYLEAYEMKKDCDKMLQKARELQGSPYVGNQYCGMFYELRVSKLKGQENWKTKYKDRINFWTKKMIEDPTDFVSAGYRIRAFIDLGELEKAEQLSENLPKDAKQAVMNEINKARAQGGVNNGDSYQ